MVARESEQIECKQGTSCVAGASYHRSTANPPHAVF